MGGEYRCLRIPALEGEDHALRSKEIRRKYKGRKAKNIRHYFGVGGKGTRETSSRSQ